MENPTSYPIHLQQRYSMSSVNVGSPWMPVHVLIAHHPKCPGRNIRRRRLVGLAVNVNEPLMSPCWMIPRAHAGTDIPEVMMKRAHFHQRRLVETGNQLEYKFGAIMPTVFRAAEYVLSIQSVQVDHIKTAFVVHFGVSRRHFGKQCGIRIRNKQTKTLFEMMDFGICRVDGFLCPIGAPFAVKKCEGRFSC